MSKYLSIVALVALGVLGLSAQAAVAFDPQDDCAGQQQGVKFGWIDTEPDTQGAVSEFWGGAVLCGSNTDTERGYTVGKIQSPALTSAGKGMTFRCANTQFPSACDGHPEDNLASGQFTGSNQIDLMACRDGLGCGERDNQWSNIYVNKHPSPLVPPDNECWATYQGKPVVACLQGADQLVSIGWSNMLITRDEDGIDGTGVYNLYIFQPHAIAPAFRLYYTKIGSRGVYDSVRQEMIKDPGDTEEPLHVCKYAGAVGSTTCGTDPNDWLQKNGGRQAYGCTASGYGQLPVAVPWGIRATRTPGWSPANANACTPERWTP